MEVVDYPVRDLIWNWALYVVAKRFGRFENFAAPTNSRLPVGVPPVLMAMVQPVSMELQTRWKRRE